jgi:hypothetical protein
MNLLLSIHSKMRYNVLVVLTTSNPTSFLVPCNPTGAVCQQGYSSEQVDWDNQTVPLGFFI